MTYTGSTSHLYYHEDIEMNNRFSALESINGNSRYIEIDYYEEIFPSFIIITKKRLIMLTTILMSIMRI